MKRKKEHTHYQAVVKNPPKTEQVVKLDRWKCYAALAVIALISFFVYLPALQNGFVWDDIYYIKNNPLIYSFNLKEIFTKIVMSCYHPVTILTLAIEYHFFGLNESGYHAVNLLLHLLNVILVFYTVLLLSDKAGIALVASLLFGIHPIHVESVAWVSELKDLLYTFFFLASYIFYLKYLKNRHKKFYFFALLLFSISLLSKAMAASLPVVLILTDYFKGRQIHIKTILEKVPFFLLAIALGVVAIIVQKSSGAISDIAIFTFPQRLVFATYGFITYLLKLFLPLHLSAFYPYPIMRGGNIPIQYYAYLILFATLVAFVFYSLRFTKKIFFSLGFFTITVFLVLQLLPVGGAIMADRYSYIPSIGIFYLAGEGFNLLWGKKLKWIAIILLSAFTVFFSVKTYDRCGIWKNELTLWDNVISQYKNVPYAYYNRGFFFVNEKKYDRALEDFNKAIELKPNYTDAYLNRGFVFMDEKRYDRALEDFNKAIELKPNYAKAYYNRGNVFWDEKKYDRAIEDYSKAIELNPNYSEAYVNRGLAEFYFGKKDTACIDLKQAASLGYQPALDALSQICK
jgi:protein O-mannosyl-transferase